MLLLPWRESQFGIFSFFDMGGEEEDPQTRPSGIRREDFVKHWIGGVEEWIK